MNTYPASEKLTKTEFNSYEDWLTYPTADYICDACKQTVSFDFNSLAKHQFSDFTNFTDVDKNAFKRYTETNELIRTNSFLDFYCPTCKRPVRLYYNSWAGGRHGESGYSIKFIVD